MKKITSIILYLLFSSSAMSDTLSWDGWGDIKFGTTINSDFKPDPNEVFGSEYCQYMLNEKYPNVRFMVEKGVINRADVPLNSKTNIGILASQTISEMKEIFPAMKKYENKYSYEGNIHDLYFYNHDKTKAIVIIYSEGKSQMLRAGKLPVVGYVEGCG
jgi:hypothetical protein